MIISEFLTMFICGSLVLSPGWYFVNQASPEKVWRDSIWSPRLGYFVLMILFECLIFSIAVAVAVP